VGSRCIFVTSEDELKTLLSSTAPAPAPAPPSELKCPNCGAPLELKDSKFGLFYGCTNWSRTRCRGGVSAHPDGTPVGVPVDDATRGARIDAHQMFDQIWKGGRMTRKQAYLWLAEQMDLPATKAHIGLFNVEQCRRVIDIVNETLTEEEQLLMTERDLMGEAALELSEDERGKVAELPRTRDGITRKLRGGYMKAADVCRLLRIAVGGDEKTTVRNIADALKEYDRRHGRARREQGNLVFSVPSPPTKPGDP
jgi:zinc-finger-containing domain/Topoisomerase DNA binding C4 zinc finger